MKPQDFFGPSPKTVLNKPFFHAQDQKAYNVDGGTSIADAWTKRTLNTVIHNDIQGATLANDEVSLPAGTYYVEGTGRHWVRDITAVVLAIYVGNTLSLQAVGVSAGDSSSGYAPNVTGHVGGVITLSEPGVVSLRYYSGIGYATSGLGRSNNAGSITDASIPSIYADLKIWQLDRSLEVAPVAVNGGLQTIPGMNTEGGIMGGDVTVSGNTLTITKCSCMSSDLTTAMAMTADDTVVLPATINQDFYVFMVRLVADGSFDYKAYTTLAGPSSDGLVDKWRLISFAKNNGSGVTMPFVQVGDDINWTTANRPILTASVTTSLVAYSVTVLLPIANLKKLSILSYGATGLYLGVSYDGVTLVHNSYNSDPSGAASCVIAPVSQIYLKSSTGSVPVHIISATLRR